MNPKFSIIIPHHNEVNLLKRLIITLPKRSDLQVIIVDDCSGLTIQQQLQLIKSENPTYEIYFLPKNIGGGGARNFGLSKAIGDFVFFADSDDFFLPSINEILDSIDENYDIVYFNAISLDAANFHIRKRNKRLNSWIKEYRRNGNEKNLRYLFGEPWCKVIKRSILDNYDILFEETKIHNDTYFSYMSGFYARSIKVLDICGYVITEREASVSKKVSDDRLYLRAKIFFQKNIFLQKNNLGIIDRLFLSSYWEYLKHFDIRKYIQLNKKLDISMYSFFQISLKIIYQEICHILVRK